MDIMSLLVQLLSGAAGGNIAGGMMKNLSQGPLGNTLTGAIGGGLGMQIISSMLGLGATAASADPDIGAIVSQIAGGGIGGGVLTAIVGILRQAFAR